MADLLQNASPALLDLLPGPSIERLCAKARLVRYADGQIVHQRGDRKPGVSIVKSGSVRIGVLGSDGSFQIVSTLGAGQCFGEHALFAQLPRTHDVSAVGATSILEVSAAAFLRQFDQDRDLARALMAVVCARAQGLLQLQDDLRRLPLAARAGKLLLRMSASGGDAVIVCTQSEIAFTLGVSRVAAGKALGKLEGMGFIRRGYGRVVLGDPAALRAWSEAQGEPDLAPDAVR